MAEDDTKDPVRKQLSLADLVLSVLPWPFHKDLPNGYYGENSKSITIGDLVLSTLPWPFHRELPLDNEPHDGNSK